VTVAVLRFFSDWARGCARILRRQSGIAAYSPQHAFPAASSAGAQSRPAFGPWRCGMTSSRISWRRGTVRPNKSFKPMPLRGTA
jgi:hypothetical protein